MGKSGKLAKINNTLSVTPTTKPDKVETFAGKETARITKSYKQKDGSIVKITKKINKDGTISDKIEHRY